MNLLRNIINIMVSRSGMEMLVLSRWWLLNGKTVRPSFLIFMALFLPHLCLDGAHGFAANGEKTFSYAQVNISYTDDTGTLKKQSEQGKYGMDSIVTSLSGVVVHAVSSNNDYGCTKYVNKKFPPDPWYALVKRGHCSFTQKMQVAKESNATALIVYNNNTLRNDEDKTVMTHDALAIVSVLISQNYGIEIISLLAKGYIVHMRVTPNGEGSVDVDGQNSISKTSVLFVSISFIVLMIISLAWLVFYYIQRFRYSHAKERLARRLACAAKKAIAKTPQKTVKAGDKELEADFDQCAVCIEPYKAHDVIRILPCRHVFHKSCVDPWLLDQRSCPMCKLDILRAYGMQIGGSQESVHPDPESGLPATAVHEEPEVSSSAEDTQTDEVKVLLVPHSCLHFHIGQEKQEAEEGEEEEVSTSLLGEVGDSISPSTSGSLHSSGSSHSRAERSDLDQSGSSEVKALIGKGQGGKKRWKSKDRVHSMEDDDEEDRECQVSQKERKGVRKSGQKKRKLVKEKSGGSSPGQVTSSSSGELELQAVESPSNNKSRPDNKNAVVENNEERAQQTNDNNSGDANIQESAAEFRRRVSDARGAEVQA